MTQRCIIKPASESPFFDQSSTPDAKFVTGRRKTLIIKMNENHVLCLLGMSQSNLFHETLGTAHA